MNFTGTRAAVTAMVAVSAFCVCAFGTGIADGATRPAAAKQAKLPGTFQMYANVDQLGDLGSNVGATGVKVTSNEYAFYYSVTFSRPIGKCAAQVQPGYAGGKLTSGWYSSQVIFNGSKAFNVFFWDTTDHYGETAFMLTVTCPS